MELFEIPAFGEACTETHANALNRVFVMSDVSQETFDSYCALLKNAEYIKKEEYTKGTHRFAAFSKDKNGVFLNYFPSLCELTIVAEENCAYFDFADTSRDQTLDAQITQLYLEDFGMSYAIRLPDGRFIVIDGGRGFEPDIDRLFNCISDTSPEEKPIIAAWILTHPHSDHYLAFNFFMERYGEEIELQKVLLNFPDHDDLAHYPKLSNSDRRFSYSTSALDNIPRTYSNIRIANAEQFMLHTGQTYRIGDAVFEVLACMDEIGRAHV